MFPNRSTVVPPEYCEQPITEDTSLAYLLPCVQGEGICAAGLVLFLVDRHNEFIHEYARIRHQGYGNSSHSDIDIEKEVTE